MNPPAPSTWSDIGSGLLRGVLVGLALAAVLVPAASFTGWLGPRGPAIHPDAAPGLVVPSALLPQAGPGEADLAGEPASGDVREVAHWIAASHDNAGMAFVIVDKKHTKIFVFDEQARLRAATPVLLGAAAGDDTVPGIGTRPIAEVRPEERTTPAGRFVGERGRNASGEDVVWVDYDAAVSMHRVRTTNAAENRLQRLATPTTEDNRISYGCINVPAAFYDAYLQPTFAQRKAVVYVLPETKPLRQVFASFGKDSPRLASAS